MLSVTGETEWSLNSKKKKKKKWNNLPFPHHVKIHNMILKKVGEPTKQQLIMTTNPGTKLTPRHSFLIQCADMQSFAFAFHEY